MAIFSVKDLKTVSISQSKKIKLKLTGRRTQ